MKNFVISVAIIVVGVTLALYAKAALDKAMTPAAAAAPATK